MRLHPFIQLGMSYLPFSGRFCVTRTDVDLCQVWYPLLWLAIIAAGGIVTGSNPGYTQTELTHHLKITHAQFIITQDSCLDVVKEAVEKRGISKGNVFILGGETLSMEKIDGFKLWTTLLEHGRVYPDTFGGVEAQKGFVAVHACTSGTTGLPKAAEISHRYLVAQGCILEHLFRHRKHDPVCFKIRHPLTVV